jgi:hypothetical protein
VALVVSCALADIAAKNIADDIRSFFIFWVSFYHRGHKDLLIHCHREHKAFEF